MKFGIKINFRNIGITLFCLLLIISCYTVYSEALGREPFLIINFIVILIYVFLLVFGRKAFIFDKNSLIFLAFYLFSCGILLVFGEFRYLGFLSGCMIPIIFYTLFLFSKKKTPFVKNFFDIYCVIVEIICVVSLIFYILGDISGLIKATGVISKSVVSWRGADYNSYLNIYFSGQRTKIFGLNIIRNIGIFVEAPIYSYITISALYIELFFKKTLNRIGVTILCITIITTFSSTALAVGAILVFIWFYQHYMKKGRLKLFLPIAIIIAFYIAYLIIADKLSADNTSGVVRVDDLLACLKCFRDNPICGIGYTSMRALDAYRSGFRQTGGAGMSAGIPYVLASGGIMYGWVYIFPTIIGAVKLIRGKMDFQAFAFILVQAVLMTVIIVEYTLLGQFFLVICWYFALSDRRQLSNSA